MRGQRGMPEVGGFSRRHIGSRHADGSSPWRVPRTDGESGGVCPLPTANSRSPAARERVPPPKLRERHSQPLGTPGLTPWEPLRWWRTRRGRGGGAGGECGPPAGRHSTPPGAERDAQSSAAGRDLPRVARHGLEARCDGDWHPEHEASGVKKSRTRARTGGDSDRLGPGGCVFVAVTAARMVGLARWNGIVGQVAGGDRQIRRQG